MSEKSQFNLNVPSAIIIGAIIIGLAIVFAFGGNRSETPQTEKDGRPTIEAAAKEVGINQRALATCIEEDRYAETIQAHMDNAQMVGFRGTPHSVVINNLTGDMVSIGGARPIEQWRELLNLMRQDDFVVPAEDQASNVAPVEKREPRRGSITPEFTIIEYSDIDCPFCAQLHETLIEFLAEEESVQWVYRHMPIEGLHPNAYKKALAVECAYELSGQDSEVFWDYLDLLFGIETE